STHSWPFVKRPGKSRSRKNVLVSTWSCDTGSSSGMSSEERIERSATMPGPRISPPGPGGASIASRVSNSTVPPRLMSASICSSAACEGFGAVRKIGQQIIGKNASSSRARSRPTGSEASSAVRCARKRVSPCNPALLTSSMAGSPVMTYARCVCSVAFMAKSSCRAVSGGARCGCAVFAPHPLVKGQASEQTDRQERGRGTSAWSQGTQPTRQHHNHQSVENKQHERGEKDWPPQIERFAMLVDISACIQRRRVEQNGPVGGY